MNTKTKHPETTKRKNLLSIQYLRAIAAIMVVVFHVSLEFDRYYSFGRSGVDIFFVISGFIMWMVTREKEENPLLFLKRATITYCTTLLASYNNPSIKHPYLSTFIPTP